MISLKPSSRRTTRIAATGALAAVACLTVLAGSAGASVDGGDSTRNYAYTAVSPGTSPASTQPHTGANNVNALLAGAAGVMTITGGGLIVAARLKGARRSR